MSLFKSNKKKTSSEDVLKSDFSYGDEGESNSGKDDENTEKDDEEYNFSAGAKNQKDSEDSIDDIYGDGNSSKRRKVKEEDSYDMFDLKIWELAIIIIEIILFVYTLLVLLNVVPII